LFIKLNRAANTPKVFIWTLVFFIVLDGLLLYRYQLEKRDVLSTLPSTKAVAFGPADVGAEDAVEQEEPQSEETNRESDTSDDEQKDDSDAQEKAPEESSPAAKEPPSGNTREPSASSGSTGDAPPPIAPLPKMSEPLPADKEEALPSTEESSAALPVSEGPAAAEGPSPTGYLVAPTAAEEPPLTATENPTPTTVDQPPAN
jgi:hypothetical protein